MKNLKRDNKDFNEILKLIGLNVAKYRKLAGLTQEKLAELTGISSSYIGIIEAAGVAQQISLQYLYIIAKALDITLADLFEGLD